MPHSLDMSAINPFGVLIRVNDEPEDVHIDRKYLAKDLAEVCNTHRNSYVSAIDFYTDGFPETIIISEDNCKDLLERNSEFVNEYYLWLDTYEAARFLIKNYDLTHRGFNISLRLKQK